MGQLRERRFTFRLYEGKPADRELQEKMDRLLADGRFRSKNEVLRKGIALAYESCYGASGRDGAFGGLTEQELSEASKRIAEEVIRRIGEGIPEELEGCGLPEETGKMTKEMASFLSGLNFEG